MALIFQDTFTDTSGTNLDAHSPDTGTSWTKLINVGTGDIGISSDRADANVSGYSVGEGGLYTADATYTSADYEASCDVVDADSGDDPCILAVRIQDADNMYAVHFNNDASQLYKRVSSTWSTVGSSGAGVANGSAVSLKIEGTTLSFIDDSSTILSETVIDHSSAGKAGLGFGAVILSGDDSSAQSLDNYEVNTIESAGVTVTPSTLSIEITKYAPTVTATNNQEVTPTTATLTVTGSAPTVTASDSKEVTPTTLSLSITGQAPTVVATANQEVNPTTATLTLTGHEPIVSASAAVEVTPNNASLTITGYEPTVTAANSKEVTPSTLSLTVSGHPPEVIATDNKEVTPTTVALTISGNAPTVLATNNIQVVPTTLSLAITELLPSVATTSGATVRPTTTALVTTTYEPTVSVTENVLVSPVTLALTIGTYVPTVEALTPKGKYTSTLTITKNNNIIMTVEEQTNNITVQEVTQSMQVSSVPSTNITITEQGPIGVG